MSKLNTLFEHRAPWSGVPIQLQQTVEAYTRNTLNYGYVSSRSLAYALQPLNGYWNYLNPYKLLLGMCTTLLNNKPFKLHTLYRTITSTEAETLTLNNILTGLPSDTDKINITLYHIPKGKSYIKKCLDEAPIPLNRVRPIELLCVEDTTHFVRIYTGLGTTGPESITVFSDRFSTKLIQTIILMIPNILHITPVTEEELAEQGATNLDPAEFQSIKINGMPLELYNERTTILRELFEYLYTLHQNNSTLMSTEELEHAQHLITNITTNFTSKFNWAIEALDTFSKSLASAKNRVHAYYYRQQLNHAVSKISALEQELTKLYDEKTKAERAINTNTQTTEEDIAPFLETIKNTKAIEILSTTDKSMRLKITAPLQYFTESDFKAYEKNVNSDYNRYFNNKPNIKSILHKIFVTREYRLIVQGIIKIDINDSNYSNLVLDCNALMQLNQYDEFPNPHLLHHNCWSSAKREMDKNICEGNYELVVMQMVAAVQSVNIAEHASFVNGLLGDLRNEEYTSKITILDKDNHRYTWNHIIAHEQELANAEAKEKAEQLLREAQENTEGYTQIVLSEEDIDTDGNPVLPF